MPKRKPSFNTIYISKRVQECLCPIAHCALTTVVAPMGYGKTTAINWFLAEKTKGGKAVAIRMSIYSEKLPMLWRSAQDAFRFAGLDVLSAYDFPTGEAAATLVLEELCRAFSSGKTAYYLFLDDFHLLRDERAVRFICRISARLPDNAHLIVASRDRFLPAGEIVRLGGNLHQIGMEHLRLNHTELAVYAHRCGAELSEQQLEALLRSSEGWFSAIYLNLRALSERGRLPDASSDIFEMFTAAMIDPLPPGRQKFLAVMGLADEFTAEMARFVTENPETDAIIQDLTCQNAFVTRLPDSQRYRFHHMMKECALRKFRTLPEQSQTRYWNRFGVWYGAHGQYLHALGAYGRSGNNDAALTIIEKDAGNLLSALHPEELLERLNACPEEVLTRHPTAILVLMRRLFTWRQIPKMLQLKALLERAIAESPDMPEEERGNLLGECDLIMSFLLYNDITKMSRLHRSASRQMSRPAVTIQAGSSWTFGSPSVLMMYYRAPGELQKETHEMHECMPHYYRITNGHGLGAELVMDAEASFMQGKLREAEIGLERARSAIAGSRQENMALCCDFLELRLLRSGGRHRLDIKARAEALLARHDVVLLNMFESILAYYYALLQEPEKIPDVFRLHRLDTVNYFAPGKPMMELIENQVYLAQGEFPRVIGRSEPLLSVCGSLHYALVALHIRLQTASAYEALGNRAMARKLLVRALEDAEPDGFVLPFAENAPYLMNHYSALSRELETPFAASVCELSERWLSQQQTSGSRQEPIEALRELSERERSVAQLMALRKTNREIAETLFLSEGTVKQYINRIYSKLQLTGTAQEKRRALTALLQKN
ncbi:MAG: LuxR C-terminal-related transcriptional regulator [Oscillospiraceae bacterium]|nr:LuxR C-terminal-related transcriptional regulator [Oscillospiraceae bacterium]